MGGVLQGATHPAAFNGRGGKTGHGELMCFVHVQWTRSWPSANVSAKTFWLEELFGRVVLERTVTGCPGGFRQDGVLTTEDSLSR